MAKNADRMEVGVEVEAGDVGKLLADYFVDVGRTASGPIEMPAQQTKQPHMERDMWEMEMELGFVVGDEISLGQLMASADRH